jgi:hypothetical protein
MNIQELEDKHKEIIGESELNYPDYIDFYTPRQLEDKYNKEESLVTKEATKLSVEFAIDQLNSLKLYDGGEMQSMSEAIHNKIFNSQIEDKIQELKKYLDE